MNVTSTRRFCREHFGVAPSDSHPALRCVPFDCLDVEPVEIDVVYRCTCEQLRLFPFD